MPLQPAHNKAASIANKQNLPFNNTTIGSIDCTIMFATYNSSPRRLFCLFCKHRKAVAVSTLLLHALVQTLSAETNAVPSKESFIAYAKKAYSAARETFQAEPTNSEAAWKFGQACFRLAELATNDATKADIAGQAIVACRQSIASNPKSAPPHLYLGMTLGQVADTKRNLAALKMVKEMEREFNMAHELDEHFSFAGPDRNLGLLYLQAPGWPASIGSRSKARKHLERAVELAPESPENRLNLIEAYLKWGNRKEAQQGLDALEKLLPEARAKFTGEEWASSWPDWEARLEESKRKLAKPPSTSGRRD